MTEPIKSTPARPAPQLAEVRRLLDRYRRTDTRPLPRRVRGLPVLSPTARKRGD